MIKNRQKNNYLKNIPPPNQHKKPGILSTLGENMVLGAGLGVGSEAGHSIFKKVFSENKEQVYSNKNENNCIDILKMYENCLKTQSMNTDFCKNVIIRFEKYC
mgnify:CR=1 FL=1|tara:strand:- start:8048 stop:8356 length:309 start_codon:yes stop_codon:yes gene_type:complete